MFFLKKWKSFLYFLLEEEKSEIMIYGFYYFKR